MRKLIIISAIAVVVASVGYFGVVRGERAVETNQEPVVEQVEVVEPVQTPEVVEPAPEPIKQKTVSIQPKVEEEVVEVPYWRIYLDEQKVKSAAHAEAVDCIDNWVKYANAASAQRISYLSEFQYMSTDNKNTSVQAIFDKTLSERNCAERIV